MPMMTGRCETCRWWLGPRDNQWVDDYQPTEMMQSLSRGPDIAVRDRKWGVCQMTTYEPYQYTHPESLALAHDHEQYGAELLTRPDFGCVQWKEQS